MMYYLFTAIFIIMILAAYVVLEIMADKNRKEFRKSDKSMDDLQIFDLADALMSTYYYDKFAER